MNPLIEILLFALILGSWNAGLFLYAQPGMILHKIAVAVSDLPEAIAKPVLTCIPCMSSLHGVLLWTLLSFLGVFDYEFYFILSLPVASVWGSLFYHILLWVVSNAEIKKEVAEFYTTDPLGPPKTEFDDDFE